MNKKKHKKEIVIGTAAVGLTIGAGLLYKKFGVKVPTTSDAKDFVDGLMNTEVINKEIKDLPKLNIAEVTDYWIDDFGPMYVLNEFTVSDIGKLGEDLLANVDGITGDTKVTTILGLITNK